MRLVKCQENCSPNAVKRVYIERFFFLYLIDHMGLCTLYVLLYVLRKVHSSTVNTNSTPI
ncbi:hypothetical protein BDV25DRAFT_67701 [Aspergillus avenaceus]|uniref:Uncharacterized protein n=1 Tax=Aspergillus avenaceus TaxID=36643 RepID=A0A5N6U1K5_ASPAV|nr:hypothetical protein BDV25DRAFT_67701 [Aspergillus avenaceus]